MTDEEIFNALTNRQRQVAKLLISGSPCDNASIAEVMGLTGESVHALLAHLFDTIGLDNRTALAVFLLRRPGLTAMLDAVVVQGRQQRRGSKVF